MTLGPVVSSAGLAKHEVVGSEDLTEGAGPYAVHGAGLQVHEDRPGDELTSGHELGSFSLLFRAETLSLIEINIYPLKLKLRGAAVGAGWVNS